MFKEWPYASETEPLTSVEMSFAFALALGRRGTGQPLTPVRMEFAHAGPQSEARQTYFGCPIHYGARCNKLVMKSSDLDRPFPGHNMELLDILTPALTAALSEPRVHIAVADQVKTVLKRRLAAGRPEVAEVAHDLGMSERTLQRRITEAGASFRTLLVQARQELSRELLPDPSIDLDEVACLLGYQDTSSFYRAFKDWEGVTPAQWLERNGDSARAGQAPVRLI
jgi:AraC-like DNA-binding protein